MVEPATPSEADLSDVPRDHHSPKGIFCLIGGFLMNLVTLTQVAGVLNSWGTLTVYVTSYLHVHDSSVTLTTMFITFPVSTAFLCAGFGTFQIVVGTMLYHKIGARLTMLIAGSLISLCAIICSFITEAYFFAVFYGACMGFGSGCGSFTSVWPSWLYFPKRKGLATGIIMLGYGFSTVIVGLAFTFMTNPNNESPDVTVGSGKNSDHLFSSEIANNVPMSLRYLGIICACLTAVSVALVSEPVAIGTENTLSRTETTLRRTLTMSHATYIGKVNCPSRLVAMKTSAFWTLWVLQFFCSGFGFYMVNQYKSYGQEHIKDDYTLSVIGSIGFACNGVARLVLTQLLDHFSFKQVLLVNSSIQVACAFTINLVADNSVLYCIWVSVSFIGFAAALSPFAVESGVIFGHE